MNVTAPFVDRLCRAPSSQCVICQRTAPLRLTLCRNCWNIPEVCDTLHLVALFWAGDLDIDPLVLSHRLDRARDCTKRMPQVTVPAELRDATSALKTACFYHRARLGGYLRAPSSATREQIAVCLDRSSCTKCGDPISPSTMQFNANHASSTVTAQCIRCIESIERV
jgi:hypothetical protein